MFLGTFEPAETALFAARLRQGLTVVDVGANVGYYSLLAASRVGPSGSVYAFEPDPVSAERLSRTVRRNAIHQISVQEVGLGDSAGNIELFIPVVEGNRTPTMVPHGHRNVVSVPITTLDTFCANRGIPRIDVLKIDVEGFEPDVLRGADRLLRSGLIGVILIEFNQIWLNCRGTSSDELYDLLVSYGYVEVGDAFRSGTGLQNLLFESRTGR